MGFFGWIKQKLGIGGVKFEIQADGQVAQNAGQIAGKIMVTSKSDQKVTKIDVKVVEEISTGSGAEKRTRDYDLGKVTVGAAFDIKAGETKTIDFSVPFSMVKTTADSLKEKGGALGALGKGMAFMNNEKKYYFVKAEGNVAGTALGPSAKRPINIV